MNGINDPFFLPGSASKTNCRSVAADAIGIRTATCANGSSLLIGGDIQIHHWLAEKLGETGTRVPASQFLILQEPHTNQRTIRGTPAALAGGNKRNNTKRRNRI